MISFGASLISLQIQFLAKHIICFICPRLTSTASNVQGTDSGFPSNGTEWRRCSLGAHESAGREAGDGMGIIYRSLLGNALHNSVKCKVCHKITNYFKPVLLNAVNSILIFRLQDSRWDRDFKIVSSRQILKIQDSSYIISILCGTV